MIGHMWYLNDDDSYPFVMLGRRDSGGVKLSVEDAASTITLDLDDEQFRQLVTLVELVLAEGVNR